MPQQTLPILADAAPRIDGIKTLNFLIANHRVLIDADDLLLISQFRWHILAYPQPEKLYVGAHPASGVFLRMHRLILQAPTELQVDHRNLNGLDNRKANLRLCTHAQNTWNVRRRRDNKSGYKGVVWHKGTKRWCARYTHKNQRVLVGYFRDPYEAHLAYAKAISPLRSDFARFE